MRVLIAGGSGFLGTHLARTEVQLAISSFLRRFPAFKQCAEARRKTGVVSRGLASLPLRW